MNSPGGCHFGKSWPQLTTTCRHECSEAPSQTTNRMGTQPHQSTNKLPKVLQGTQPPLNTPRDIALSIRRIRLSFIHQRGGTSPSYQEACHKPLCQLQPQGGIHQKQEGLKPCSLQKGDHTERQNEMTEKYMPDIAIRQNHKRTAKTSREKKHT